MTKFHKRVTMMFCDIFISSVSSPGDDDMKIDDTDIVALDDGKARVFFIFRFTDPTESIFWKLKKKNKRDFFSILFFYFPPTHASTVLEFNCVFSFCLFYCCQVD